MMNNTIKLGNFISEYSVRNRAGDDIPVYSVTNKEGFCRDYFSKDVASQDRSTYKIVPRGCFAYNPSRINVGSVDWQRKEDRVIVSPLYVVFSVSKGLDQQYLYYYLKSEKCLYYIKELASGSVRDNLKLSMLKEFTIPNITLEEQRKAVMVLEQTDRLIALQERQMTVLDELVKSRFVEMFIGKNYSRKTVDEVSLDKGEYGAQSASVEYTSDRPRYVRITDINDDGTLNNDMVSSINHSDDDQYRLRYGDFLFARMGATVGKTYAFRKGNQIYAGYLIRYKLDLTQIHPLYLFWYTRLNEYWDWVKLNQSGAAQPGINAKKFGSLRIPVPPIDIQNRFAAFVAEVDKSKLSYEMEVAA